MTIRVYDMDRSDDRKETLELESFLEPEDWTGHAELNRI